MKLPYSFYQRTDVVRIARDLIGKVLCTSIDGRSTCGAIIETEAYAGQIDRASHAYNGRRTQRTEIMYASGGVAYVYLCYGIHHLFNVVTNGTNSPHAVLVRALHPLKGIFIMKERRGIDINDRLAHGPGTLSQALGIRIEHSGTDLTGDAIWIEDQGIEINDRHVFSGPRIGVDYAGVDALLPYRFVVSELAKLPKPE